MDNWLEISAKTVVYAAALTALGAGAVRRLLLPRVKAHVAPDLLLASGDRADRVMLLAAAGLILGVLLRAWAHTVSAFGMVDALSWDNLTLIAFESRWGGGWQAQMAAAVLLFAVSAWTPRHSPLERSTTRASATKAALVLVALAALCLAVPQTGHAAEQWLRVILHAVHLLGGGAWLGALAIVVFTMPKAVRPHLLRAFAPVAASSVALVGISGIVMMLTYVGSPLSNLWTTDYGRRLLLKLAVVGASLVVGGLNWRALHRGNGRAIGRLPTFEASLVLVIVVLTAWLTETAHP